ncbi:acyl--CoA ligase [Thiotrichales bacterium 19S3-7]|nr:acyl--CoA ligase [Thiotrichales bacterium 19S3-7]MCF6801863.1 acyl--CoA ligase [Thiotrichales bacterium 19S3-11]
MQNNLFDTIKSYGNAIAIYDRGLGYSFNYLLSLTGALANYFRENNITQGDKLYIHLENRIETVVCYLACWINGSIACPLNYRLKPFEIRSVFKTVSPCLIITDQHKESLIRSEVEQVTILAVEDFFSDIERLATSIRADEQINYNYQPDDIACIHFTSGTTGFHKAVAHSFQQINTYAFERITDMGYDQSDRLLVCLSLMHAFSFSYQLLPALVMGIPCILVPSFNQEMIIKTANHYKATSISLLPAQCYYLSQYAQEHNQRIPSLTDCISAGDALPLAIARAFSQTFNDIIPRQGLGMTECFGYTINSKENNQSHTSGKSLVGVKLSIQCLNDCDDSGEIYIHSTGNMLGYYSDEKGLFNRPDVSGIKSGDLARIDDNGFVHFKGRLRHIIVRDGSNIMPLEIENVIYQHPNVLEAAVIGVNHQVHGQLIYLAVISQQAKLSEDKVKLFISEYIADYKVPDIIGFYSELPKNATGKIDRDALKEELENKVVEMEC